MEKFACQSLLSAIANAGSAPQIIMIKRASGSVESIRGFTTQTDQSRGIVAFIKN